MKKNHGSNLPLGILCLVISTLSFTIIWAIVKYFGKDVPLFEFVFFRSFISASIIGGIVLKKGLSFRVHNKIGMLGRAIAGTVGITLSFYVVTKINMGSAATLFQTSPLFVAVLAPLFLKERTSASLILWIIIAFAGVILVVRPTSDIFDPAAFYALLVGVCAAIAYTTLKNLHKTEHVYSITFYFLLFATTVSFPIMVFDFRWPNEMELMALVATGVFGTIAQLSLTYAFKWAPANVLAPFNNTAILFSFIFGWLFFGEIPDWLTIIGATIIVASIIIITKVGRRLIKEDAPPPTTL